MFLTKLPYLYLYQNFQVLAMYTYYSLDRAALQVPLRRVTCHHYWSGDRRMDTECFYLLCRIKKKRKKYNQDWVPLQARILPFWIKQMTILIIIESLFTWIWFSSQTSMFIQREQVWLCKLSRAVTFGRLSLCLPILIMPCRFNVFEITDAEKGGWEYWCVLMGKSAPQKAGIYRRPMKAGWTLAS